MKINVGTELPLLKIFYYHREKHHCAALCVRSVHVCVHEERGKTEPTRPRRFQFSFIAKGRWFIIFSSQWKGSKRPLLWGLPVLWTTDAQEAEPLVWLVHRKRCPPRAPRLLRPPAPSLCLRTSLCHLSKVWLASWYRPGVWQPAAV